MPKRPPSPTTDPIDIFTNPRFEQAMARSTAPAEPAPAVETRRGGEGATPTVAEPSSKIVALPGLTYEEPAPKATESPEIAPQRSQSSRPKSSPRAAEKTEPEPLMDLEQNVTLKFRVPQGLRSEFQTFKAELSGALGVTLDDSNIARPYLELLLADLRERVLEAAGGYRGRLRRPANGDTVGMAEFDHALGEIFREARGRKRSNAGER